MHPRRVIALTVAVCAALTTSSAGAWQEAHEVGDEARVHVESDGTSTIEHTLRWHVLRGPLKSLDIAGIDARAAVDSDVAIVADDGRTFAAHASRREDGAVHIALDDPRGLGHGTFAFHLRWSLDLAAAGSLARDGASWRLLLASPPPPDGFDGARLILDVPAAPDAPQPIVAETGLIDDGLQTSLRREGDRDVLELVRPHVARDEAATWAVRLDPKAIVPGGGQAATRTTTTAIAEPTRLPEVLFAIGLAGLALAFAALVSAKGRAVAGACKARKASARPLLPLSDAWRAAIGGLAFALGVGLQLRGHPTAGGALVAVAVIAAAHRGALSAVLPRGPGRWLVLRPDEAFARSPRPDDWFDAGTRAGRFVVAIGGATLLACAVVAARVASEAAWTAAIDLAALAPLALTGRASQLRPNGAEGAAPWLCAAYRRLAAFDSLRVAPWARVVLGGAIDELRLLVAPRASLPGFVGLELALAWSSTTVGWTPSPEILVRVLEASAASAKLGTLCSSVPGLRAVPGRRPEERVVRFLPAAPTRGAAVALARGLADALTDRRLPAEASWRGPERRRPESSPANPRDGSPLEISAFRAAC
jgi:hypothetical protein